MQIRRSLLFKEQFIDIVLHIAKDKKSAAKDFKNTLNYSIDNLQNFPYKYRKSYYYKDETIRDMTFKGYTIIYRIDEAKELIEILEIFHKNLPIKEEK
jgi:plasmid stabilization system protein ParE